MSLEKVTQAIYKYDKFLLCSHINLEGDALGSQLGLASLLRKIGKKVYTVDSDKPPLIYKFLPGVNKITQEITEDMDFEVAIFVDCSDLERAGKITDALPEKILSINIDHHISNSNFAKINWVEPNSSSSGEMVYKLFKRLGIKFSRNDAVLLYTAMLTDTGSFRYPNTTAFTHEAVADLLKFGISVSRIYQLVYESNYFSDVILVNKALSTLQRNKNGKVIWLEITRDMASGKVVRTDQTESILNFARSIKGVEVVLLFKQSEDKKETRINLRSQGHIDVNKIANFFGGGGHRTASGCTIKQDLEISKKIVLDKIDEEFKSLRE